MAKNPNAEPAFNLTPRHDQEKSTLRYLERYFEENPDGTLSVTVQITAQGFSDYARGKRAGLGFFKGRPRRKRS